MLVQYDEALCFLVRGDVVVFMAHFHVKLKHLQEQRKPKKWEHDLGLSRGI